MSKSKTEEPGKKKEKCMVCVSKNEPCNGTLASKYAVKVIVKGTDETIKLFCKPDHCKVSTFKQELEQDLQSLVTTIEQDTQPPMEYKCHGGCKKKCSSILRVESAKIKPDKYKFNKAQFYCSIKCLISHLSKYGTRDWAYECNYQCGKNTSRKQPSKTVTEKKKKAAKPTPENNSDAEEDQHKGASFVTQM